jgi:thiaminase/transcriptional activator TenA
MSPARNGEAASERVCDRLRAAAAELWEAQHAHPFVRGIGDGTLDGERFRHFIRQDSLYLVDYGRLLALACARAPDLTTMSTLAELTRATLVTEMGLHRALAAEWGIDGDDLEAQRPTATTRAYTDFLLRTAALGDFAELVAALLPCMWGYAEVGSRLAAAGAPAHAGYARWIAEYASAPFQQQAAWCRELLDRVARDAGPAAFERLRAAFVTSSRHELAFWDASWRLEATR